MSVARVAVTGCDGLRRRISDAVRECEELKLVLATPARDADVVATALAGGATRVHVRGAGRSAPLDFIGGPGPRPIASARALRVPAAEVVALTRIANALSSCGSPRRLFATVLRPSGETDSLAPIARDDAEAPRMLGGRIADVSVRVILAPLTETRVLTVRIDFARAPDRNAALAALAVQHRLLVRAGADGFPDTAAVREHARDSGARRGDRPSPTVWEETVQVDQKAICLIADVHPDATSVPDVLDAILWLTRRRRRSR